jgi:hypothetical protein
VNIYDLFLLETPDDVASCALSGVFDIGPYDLECENCRLSVGICDDEVFIPFSVLVDHDDVALARVYPVCIDCIAPAIMPGMWFSTRKEF